MNDPGLPRPRFAARAIGRRLPHAVPFSITVTIKEVLEVASDADMRADVLEHTIGRIPITPLLRRKVESLHDMATELRRSAAGLADRWAVPK